MKIYKDFPLNKHNAFKLNVYAKEYVSIKSKADIKKLIKKKNFKNNKYYILGLGFNTLFTGNFDGLIIKIEIKGIKKIKETEKYVWLEIGAGEDWIKLVNFTVQNNLSGIENLTLIPGCVGSAPVGNIGAYGQNFEDVFVKLYAFNLLDGKQKTFSKKDCGFTYRKSIFKNSDYKQWLITNVVIKLSKNPNFNLSYFSRNENIKNEIEKYSQKPYKLIDISRAVNRIRRRKFPNWNKVGTAGSFFLNPVISKTQLKHIQKKLPDIQYYPINKLTYAKPDDSTFRYEDHVKIAAGWLLEEAGWKGKRVRNVGTSPNQSLVVINYEQKTNPSEIIKFTQKMKQSIKEKFKIELEEEVNII